MTIHDVISAISSVGFPVVACAYLAWYQKTVLDKFRETMEKNTILLEKLLAQWGD